MLKFLGRVGTGLAAGLCFFGCGPHLDRNETAGELGNGAFRYDCVGTIDALCPNGGRASTFPERIATTGTFDVKFEAFNSGDIAGFDIVAAAEGIVEEESGVFRAKAPGVVALLAKRTSDGRVLDLVHIEVLDIEKIRFESKGQTPRVIWSVGARQALRPVPLDNEGAVLAGGIAYDWTTSDQTVVRLERANPTADMELLPMKAGSAIISTTGGKRTDTLSVTVEGQGVIPPDGGEVLTDGGVDGGRDAGGGVEGGSPGTPDGAAPPDSGTAEGGQP